jgi:ketopantoate reductase
MNRYVVEQGRKSGISAPINAALTKMVQEIEHGERSIHPNNLNELIQMSS